MILNWMREQPCLPCFCRPCVKEYESWMRTTIERAPRIDSAEPMSCGSAMNSLQNTSNTRVWMDTFMILILIVIAIAPVAHFQKRTSGASCSSWPKAKDSVRASTGNHLFASRCSRCTYTLSKAKDAARRSISACFQIRKHCREKTNSKDANVDILMSFARPSMPMGRQYNAEARQNLSEFEAGSLQWDCRGIWDDAKELKFLKLSQRSATVAVCWRWDIRSFWVVGRRNTKGSIPADLRSEHYGVMVKSWETRKSWAKTL